MNIKNDLNLAFKPKTLSSVVEANVSKGIKFMATYMGIWLVIHIIIAVINGLIDGKTLGGTFLFSLLTGLSVAILVIVGLLLTGLVGSYISKLFKGMNDVQRTISLVSYGILPIFIISVVRDLILLISTIGNHFLATGFFWLNLILFIITFVWLALLLTEAVYLANNVTKGAGFVCFFVGGTLGSLFLNTELWAAMVASFAPPDAAAYIPH